MAGGAFQRAAADIARRVGLLIFAAMFLSVAVLFACAAMAMGLAQVMPLWAALATTAGTVLLICLILLLMASREPGAQKGDGDGEAAGPDAQAAAIGAALGRSVRRKPKTTLLLALGAGLVLGLNPGLRRDIFALLRDPPER